LTLLSRSIYGIYSTLSLKTEKQVHNFCPLVVHSAVDERDEIIYTKCNVIAFIIEIMPGFWKKIRVTT